MSVKIITSADRLYKGKIVEIQEDGWIVVEQELSDRVQINPQHIVAIED
jgi:hypothetical protein